MRVMQVKPLLLSLMLGLGAALPSLSTATDAASKTQSVARVSSPEIIQILSVDGDEQLGAMFGSRARTLELTPGEHVVSVRYTQLFQLGADDHDIIKSAPIAFRFTAEAGKHYTFTVNPPKRHDAAVAFAKNPDIRLVDSASGESRSGILVKSLGQASLVDTMSKAFQTATNDDTTGANGRLESLKTLWLNATPAEKQAFAAWLAAQAAAK